MMPVNLEKAKEVLKMRKHCMEDFDCYDCDYNEMCNKEPLGEKTNVVLSYLIDEVERLRNVIDESEQRKLFVGE